MESQRGFGLGPVGILLALLAVFVSYMACLHGVELEQKSLAAFGIWSIVGIIFAFIADLLFKFVLILAVLFVAALVWTGNPAIDGVAAQSKAFRAGLCDRIPLDNPDVPIKDWIC